MGRYLACGVVSKIVLSRDESSFYRDHDFNIASEKENIIKELGKKVNIQDYQCFDFDDGYVFKIDKDLFNENIHGLLNEYCKKIKYGCRVVDSYLTNVDYNTVLAKEKHLLELCEYEKGDYKEGALYLKCGLVDNLDEDTAFYPDQYYLFKGNKRFKNNLRATVYYIKIWFDFSKISCEDETGLKYLLDYFSKGKFKNPLGKDVLFYISG